jgi:MarR family transcriptional regulator, organic hydroperoxide resistance regulator
MVKRLAQEGGHPGEVFCLKILSQHDGMSQRDLADRLNLSRPWITKMLQSMEKAGVVTRLADDLDQRVTRVYLTPAGRIREAELHAVWADYLNETVGFLSEDERIQLDGLIRILADRISGLLANPEEAVE